MAIINTRRLAPLLIATTLATGGVSLTTTSAFAATTASATGVTTGTDDPGSALLDAYSRHRDSQKISKIPADDPVANGGVVAPGMDPEPNSDEVDMGPLMVAESRTGDARPGPIFTDKAASGGNGNPENARGGDTQTGGNGSPDVAATGGDTQFGGYGNPEDARGGDTQTGGYGNPDVAATGGDTQFGGYGNPEDARGGDTQTGGYGNPDVAATGGDTQIGGNGSPEDARGGDTQPPTGQTNDSNAAGSDLGPDQNIDYGTWTNPNPGPVVN
ncbi:hypothetical protein [Streptomyces sp. NPDC058255]|uniref:hypothetical protein n=1 Tax=Streptomyces sp. NPDC058255 TaxID=3346407 RepID=UPI0036E8AA1B